jgi:energy-coupling factor transporter ATP-binding protein EcfA2
LVLIGENGSGKSTLANLIYFFLTRQWQRVREYRFALIEATLNDRTISLTPEQLDQHLQRVGARHVSYPARSSQLRLNQYLAELSISGIEQMLQDPDKLRPLAREFGLPIRVAHEMIMAYLHDPKERTEVQKITEEISSIVSEQFLYLPTYRRIEHDLQHIFRGGDIDIDELRRSLVGGGSEAYIELVHFGMEDVEQKIQGRMVHLKESLRSGFNNLTGSYLRDVIQGVYKTVSFENLRDIDVRILDSILARFPNETLPQQYKSYLTEKVGRFAQASFEPGDNVIAHFLLKLLDLYKVQQEAEKDVREFVDVCNVYLTGKKLVYDNAKYEITIEVTGPQTPRSDVHEILRLRMLSSGEKQIISLFSHIYLSTGRRFFVIIDEPELSLSVPWQRRFLPDILDSDKCDGLVAVTHSPFIWENELGQYVQSLPELTEIDNGVR